MSVLTASRPQAVADAGKALAAAVLLAAVTFNPILALANAHVMQVSQGHVVLAEAALVGVATALIASHAERPMLRWIGMLAIVVGLSVFLGLANQHIEPKYIRDVALIPIFIMLGMLYARFNIAKLMFVLQSLVLSVLLFEAISPRKFGDVFNVLSYYVNTREFTAQAFWNPEFALFISATRPSERFLLGFVELHRLSSVFLEPVSLGNYAVIITMFTLAFWQRMSAGQKAFFAATTAIILVGSDGRLAFVMSLVLLAGYFAFPRLPRYVNLWYLPAIVLMAALWVALAEIPAGDDFPGRVSASIGMLATIDLAGMLGLRQSVAGQFADSGIAYFVATHSFAGVALVWLFIASGIAQDERAKVIYLHGICIFIALTLLVSYSIFSIKTAALMWFIYGYLHAQPAPAHSAPASAVHAPASFRPTGLRPVPRRLDPGGRP